MFLIGAIGTIWVWWLRRHLPESPRWLERVGRNEEAEAILQRIEHEATSGGPLPPLAETPASSPRRVPLSILFSRAVLRRTLLAIIINISCLFGSYSLTGWMPTFFVSQGMTVTKSLAFTSAMMAGWIIGPVICIFLADRVGRRWGIVAFGVLCTILGTIYPLLTTPTAIILCGMLLVSAVSIFLTLGLGGTPELFPTEYRFRGGGLAQMAGRAGLIISPFVILTLFQNYGISGVIVTIAGMYLAVALLTAIAGIETNQQPLEALEPQPIERGTRHGATSPIRHPS